MFRGAFNHSMADSDAQDKHLQKYTATNQEVFRLTVANTTSIIPPNDVQSLQQSVVVVAPRLTLFSPQKAGLYYLNV
jgi:hypothetical protein